MSSVFSQIMAGELPGNFIYSDRECVVLATIAPAVEGHALVIPRREIPDFTDADPELFAHLAGVAQIVGAAAKRAFGSVRAGLIIAGFEVDHLHIHVLPINSQRDLDLDGAAPAPAEQITAAAQKLRRQLIADGHGACVPADISKP